MDTDAMLPELSIGSPRRSLTAIEVAVISLAQSEGPSTLHTGRNRLGGLLRDQRNWRLADPRLEALRRFAILSRRQNHALPEGERQQLLDAGFDVNQLDQIKTLMLSLSGRAAKSATPSSGHRPLRRGRLSRSFAFPVRLGIAVAAYVGMTPPALAQDRTTAAGQAAADTIAPTTTEPPSQNHVILGVGAAYLPAYQGSKDYRLLPLPAIDIAQGALFANLRDGVGVHVIDSGGVQIGVGVAPMQGYRTKDVPLGIGELSFGLGARLSGNVMLGRTMLSGGVTKGIAFGNKGVIADLGVSYPIMLSPRLTIVPALTTTWTDARYANRYFGVSASQSRVSGLPVYRPGSGFNDASVSLSASYMLTNRLILGASAGVTTLVGDNSDSPFVHRKTQPTGFLSIGYRF